MDSSKNELRSLDLYLCEDLYVRILDHMWTTFGPYVGHIWTKSGPNLDQIWTKSGPNLDQI